MSGSLHPIRTEDEFDQLLATSDKPVLVDVGASWCAPCQALTPILEGFAKSQDAVQVVALDADDPRALSWRLGGGSIPRMFLFDRGVLQMQVAGVRDRAWLDDVVGGYTSLGITEPDGLPIAPRTPARQVKLPEPTAGSAGLMVVHGHDNEFDHGIQAPVTVDVTPSSITVLMVSTDAIESGYLSQLDAESIDQIRVAGIISGKHLDEMTHLTSLQSVQGSAFDQQRLHEKIEATKAKGETPDFPSLLQQMEIDLSLEDLRPLTTLPMLRRVDIMGGPALDDLLPNLIGDWWLAPGVAAARQERGLPEYDGHEERDDLPFSVGCLLSRREDGLLEMKLNLTIADGWYAYPPGSDEGVPVGITIRSPHRVVEQLSPAAPAPHLQDKSALLAVLDGPEDEVRVDVTVQACDGTTCLPPTTTALVVPLMHRVEQ